MRRLFLAPALLLALAACLWFRLSQPYAAFHGEVFVDIPRGTSSGHLADMLARAGVVRSRWDFWLARAANRSRTLKAGEYRFDHPASVSEVLSRIARGDIFYYELVVPEGKNMFDIGAAVQALGLFQEKAFLKAARNPALIRDMDARAPTLEGYLFPSTYRLSRHTTPEGLCRMMTARFRESWKGLHTAANVHETITLASLVEKEGKLAGERPNIAAVFENRLRIGMKLDCDPTVIYADQLANRHPDELLKIYKSDLSSDGAYNTYRHAGLPPGPIANPGLASIEAVLHPSESDALYFVARPDGSGGHEFSKNIAAHEAATARYRRGLQR